METVTLRLEAFGETLEEDIDVPRGKTTPRRLLPIFQSMAETMIEHGVARARAEGREVSCRRGCDACCRSQLVPISPMEARNLRDLVEAMPEPRRTALLARFAAARARLAESGLLGRLTHARWTADEEAYDALAGEVRALGIACPFLADDGACSIYEDRPIVCREFVVTTPAKNCEDPKPGAVQAVPLPGQVSRALSALEPARPGKTAPWTPITLALDWARAHPEQAPARTGAQVLEDFFAAAARIDAETNA